MADQFFGLTDTGKQRTNNEDTFIAHQAAGDKFIIACVIDGVGGYAGGEIAAELAREAILQRLSKPSGEVIPMMIDCFNQANEKILEEKKSAKEYDSMACVATLALVDIEHNQFYYVHVGDTRLYLMRDQSLVKISHDQSFVGFLEDSGRLTEAEAMNHPKRNEINKALGFETNLAKDSDYIETGQSPFLPGDLLLLCSDGLTDLVNKHELTNILTPASPLKDKCRQLISAANSHGGKDNITAVLVQNNKQPLTHNATMPAAGAKKNEPETPPTLANQHENHVAGNPKARVQKEKKNNTFVTILSVMVIIFLGTSIWQFLKSKHPDQNMPKEEPEVITRPLNKQEIKLQQAIDQAKGHIVIIADTAYTSPIIISQAIQIKNDSLMIKIKGNIQLQSDSLYQGAAFSLAVSCKSIVLDSITFNNFKTGISSFNTALSLKNTRFINCAIPLQNGITIPGKKYISGKMSVPVFKADSLPLIPKRK